MSAWETAGPDGEQVRAVDVLTWDELAALPYRPPLPSLPVEDSRPMTDQERVDYDAALDAVTARGHARTARTRGTVISVAADGSESCPLHAPTSGPTLEDGPW